MDAKTKASQTLRNRNILVHQPQARSNDNNIIRASLTELHCSPSAANTYIHSKELPIALIYGRNKPELPTSLTQL